jgi:hypothetical protein
MFHQDAAFFSNPSTTESEQVIAALERLRDSSRAKPTTGADWAVLLAVESSLKRATDAKKRPEPALRIRKEKRSQ